MKLHVENGAGLGKLVRAAAAGQLDKALGVLRGELTEARAQDEAVHEVRKRLKEVRALVRLVREGIGDKTFCALNGALRDAGRPLSEVRDATAVMEALEKLPGANTKVRGALQSRRVEIRRRVIEGDKALDKARLAVEAVRAECESWKVDGGWRTLAAGLEGAYRKGRKRMGEALGTDEDEAWHAWRKRVKDLRHQVEMLSPLWPRGLKALAKEAHGLTDLLGDDHDLAVLAGLAPGLAKAVAPRREHLRRLARALGARLFAEKPAAFVKRVHQYWRAREDADGESAAEGD